MSWATLFGWSRCLEVAPPLRCITLNQETAQKGWWKHASTNLFCQIKRCRAGRLAGSALPRGERCRAGYEQPLRLSAVRLALFEAELAQALGNVMRDESASQHHRDNVGQVPVEDTIAIVGTKGLLPGDDVPEVLA